MTSRTVYRSPTESGVLGADSTLSGRTIIPGFELPLSELFKGL